MGPRRVAGLLLVRRINYFDGSFRVGVPHQRPAISLSHDEILRRYRGIEGEPWPECLNSDSLELTAGLASLDQYDHVTSLYKRIAKLGIAELLYLSSPVPLPEDASIPEGFSFHGYDYGFLHSELSHYSVVFNEIIYGSSSELRELATSLNDSLLIALHETVRKVHELREQLLRTGADIEDAERCEPTAIYARDIAHCPPL
jgi:hypothetical protein